MFFYILINSLFVGLSHEELNYLSNSTGSDNDNTNAASTIDTSHTSQSVSAESASSFETSPSTRQHNPVTQSTIIKRKGVLKPESAAVEVILASSHSSSL